MSKFPFRGAVLNAVSVAVGATIGLVLRTLLDASLLGVVLTGMGLFTMALAVKMFAGTKNVLIPAASIALGGIVGQLVGIAPALAMAGDSLKSTFGGTGLFTEGLVTSTVLFCIGPMTLLGCLQEALEGKIELIAVKSLMDGISAVFLAAAMGIGVLVTAVIVLLLQGTTTLMGRQLRPLAERPELLSELTATGGVILLGIGINLAEVKVIKGETYLPALIIAPLIAHFIARRAHKS